MIGALYVAVGGALGALARYGVSLALLTALGRPSFWGTLVANSIGCFAIGVLAGWAEGGGLSDRTALFAFTGFLGAFTTFSTFSLETLALVRADALGTALAYSLGSVVTGVLLAWLGFALTRPIAVP